jgi:antitoxin component YwqK of YwqJK toxin-antitoxin module
MKTVFTRFFENGIILEQSIYKNNDTTALPFKDAQGNVVSKGLF